MINIAYNSAKKAVKTFIFDFVWKKRNGKNTDIENNVVMYDPSVELGLSNKNNNRMKLFYLIKWMKENQVKTKQKYIYIHKQ